MKVEFVLKDRNGVELSIDDKVKWYREDLQKKPEILGLIFAEHNSREVYTGKLVFISTREQADVILGHNHSYMCLYFVDDTGKPTWYIESPSDKNYCHPKLEKVEMTP